MIKIIFLDIDGVLNNQIMYDDESRPDVIRTSSGELSKRCVALLNKLTDETDAKIVLSSTWRSDIECVDNLRHAGVTW